MWARTLPSIPLPPTSFRLFGYPGLAMLCFLAATGLGFWLVVTILLSDRASQKHRPD
jgi:hypothetical protein